jgi:hypothetical protein
MKKQTTSLDETEYQSHSQRLRVIAETSFGTLSDEAILEILAERRTLEKENAAYEKEREEEQQAAAAQAAERTALEQALEELNTAITPDKDDETLLSLVAQRKDIEAKLVALGKPRKIALPVEELVIETTQEESAIKLEKQEVVSAEPVLLTPEVVEVSVKEEKAVVAATEESLEPRETKKTTVKKVLDERIGEEKINMNLTSTEAKDFLQSLETNPDEALTHLEGLSGELKKDKSFMLKVAAVDPAYAMHYADPKTLKKDEDFNIKIAALKNPRNSGNPLAEMLSEARTGKVVMAAVKNDFRNLRYATPDMEGYAEILEVGKNEAREKVKALGQAVDLRMFLPKVLREDAAFLEEAETIVKALKEKQQKTE